MYAILLTYFDSNRLGDHTIIVSNPHDLFMITGILDSAESIKSFKVYGIPRGNVVTGEHFWWGDLENNKWRTTP